METLQNGRTDPWYMLDNAETCIKALARADAARACRAVELSDDGCRQDPQDRPEATLALERAKRGAGGRSPRRSPLQQAEAVDPQFLELFIEEAKEEIASIQRGFPLWDQNPMDLESLGSLRRSFHTLKGSGRMVGARLIAEFAWSIENLLNRIIDKTLSRTPGMMSLLRSAVAALPQLVEQLETGRQNRGAAGCHHGARLCLRRRPRSRTAGRGAGAGGSCGDLGPRLRGWRGAPQSESPRADHGAAGSRSRAPWIRSCTRSTARKPRAIWPKSAITCTSAWASPRPTICRSPCIAPSTP